MNKPLNSPTTRSRSPTLSSSPPYFPSDPNSNSISTFQKQPPLYTFENSDAYLNDTSSAHPTLPLPQPQVVTIPSPFSSTVTSPHQDMLFYKQWYHLGFFTILALYGHPVFVHFLKTTLGPQPKRRRCTCTFLHSFLHSKIRVHFLSLVWYLLVFFHYHQRCSGTYCFELYPGM
ncbi:hypothetical protein HMI55_005739 [Coelomomyces lativittatus]|nr:hypothetical protein HMI55_005739 [Coelomomyces lativittatus]